MKKILFFVPINRTYVKMPPIGLGYLATVAREEGYGADILNCLKEDMAFEQFEDYIKKNPADIFGISMMTFDFNPVKEHIQVIRKIYPNSLIILGGSHPSGDYENVLDDYPDADLAFRGEAEVGIRELLTELKKEEKDRDYSKVHNLLWRDKSQDNKVIINPWKVMDDLDSLDFPAWDLMDPREYPRAPHGAFAKNFPIAPMVITRGCPFRCTFCSGKTVTGNKIRKRSIKNVIDEIIMLKRKYGVREIHIEDENFTLHKDLVMEFSSELINKKLNISWSCPSGVRLDTLDKEMLMNMEKSGCYSLAVGVEFGSDRIHKLTKKSLTLDIIKQRLDLLSKYDIKVTGFFLMGIPGETKEDMMKTAEFARKLKIDRAQFNNFMPLPGSEVYKEFIEKGKKESINTDHFFVHDVGYVPEGLTREEMKNIQRKAYIRFYLRPRIIYGLLKDVTSFDHFKHLFSRFLDGLK